MDCQFSVCGGSIIFHMRIVPREGVSRMGDRGYVVQVVLVTYGTMCGPVELSR